MEGDMRKSLVPVVLIVGMMWRLIYKGLAVQALKARDEPGFRLVKDRISENLKQFVFEMPRKSAGSGVLNRARRSRRSST
jgi:hypothetical protein